MYYLQTPGLKKQQGLGYTGYMLVLSVGIFIGLFAFKVGPNYMENWTVTKVAQDLAEKPDVLKQPRSRIYAHINQAFRTNNLWDMDAKDVIRLDRHAKKGYLITVQYEKRDTLLHNIDIVTSFEKTVNGDPAEVTVQASAD
jgi:uncharacterized membrane-anchored protein YhcB (DUF1043 family)